jgi:GDP-L-fucose synthase
VSIRELAETLVQAIHPTAAIRWDRSKPDGAPRKLLDVSMLAGLGWTAPTSLEDGIGTTFEWFEANYSGARGVRVTADAGAR